MALLKSDAELKAYHTHLPGAERFSFVTHAAGALLAVAALLHLVLTSTRPAGYAASAVYGASLIVLFSASSLHHAWRPRNDRGRLFLRQLDHGAIFFLIAGTYAPYCLLVLPPAWGITILAIVSGLGLAGIAQKVFAPFAPRWIGVALYLIVGWCVVVAFVPLWNGLARPGFWLMAAGGLVYSAGAVMYALRKPDLWPLHVGFHGLWHLFVLAAAALQYASVAIYVER